MKIKRNLLTTGLLLIPLMLCVEGASCPSEERSTPCHPDTVSGNFSFYEKDGKAARYDISVHRWIVKRTVQFLLDKGIGDEAFRNEISIYEDELVRGAEDEDDIGVDVFFRFLRHFYRPADDRGYYAGGTFQENAFDWGWNNSVNSYDYTDAINKYKSGSPADKLDAYYALGHVLHLIADVSLPEHTHLEYHGPGDRGGYETYVTIMIRSDENAPLPSDIETILYNTNDDLKHLPPKYRGKDESSGIVKYNTLKKYIKNLAKISYYLNRYKADLSDTSKSGPSVGPLGKVFPDITYGFCPGNHPSWYITDVGCLGTFDGGGTEWWNTREEPENDSESEGFYYLEKTGHAVPEKYKTYWNPDNPKKDRYGVNTEKLPLEHLYARDLIPLAIRYTAGVIELFWRQTHISSLGTPNSITTIGGAGNSG
ncbi:MAG: hypothetical protein HY354_00925 [Planctomycetes bacterium]|nr:hypothetical protein [Planctomycetota bacterium]